MLPSDVNAAPPPPPVQTNERLWQALWLVTLLLLPSSLYAIFVHAPVEARMGIAQKIFYFHVPSAYAMYIGFGAAAVGSVGYLWRRSLRHLVEKRPTRQVTTVREGAKVHRALVAQHPPRLRLRAGQDGAHHRRAEQNGAVGHDSSPANCMALCTSAASCLSSTLANSRS